MLALTVSLMTGFAAETRAQDDEEQETFLNQIKENITQARVLLMDLERRKGSERSKKMREALDMLSRAYILIDRLPSSVTEQEEVVEMQRFAEKNIRSLGSSAEIVRAKEDLLERAISLYRLGNIGEALILFEELRMLNPMDKSISFLIKQLGKKLDASADK